jgi:hypothetical protein
MNYNREMETTCAVCGAAISGSDVMYAADGRTVCTKCFGTMDAAAASALASPSRKFAVAGWVTGAVPFFLHASSESISTSGVVYRDYVAIACGIAAAVLGGLALRAAPKEQPQRKTAMTGGFIALGLGLVQIVRGFGVL